MNNFTGVLLGIIVILGIICSIQHEALDKYASANAAHLIEDKMEKEKNIADKQAAKEALTQANHQLVEVNQNVAKVLSEPVKANCDDVLKFLVEHAGKQK